MAPVRSYRPSTNCAVLILLLSSMAWPWSCVRAAGNIDTLEPIVKRTPAPLQVGSTGIPGDWFGYSATLHQLQEPGSFDEALQYTRIIVGAPRGTFPGGLPLTSMTVPENETGLVYNCPILGGSCDRVGSGEGSDERLFDSKPNDNAGTPNMVGVKSEQLMGATVVSSGDFFVACAPRFSLADDVASSTIPMLFLDSRRPVGRCFISPRNLTGFTEMQPCVPGTSISDNNSDRCLAGSSVIINTLNDDLTSVVLGTPGDIGAQGGARFYNVNGTSAQIDGVPVGLDSSGVATNTYQSYAMTTGNITGNESLDYILSVPRSNGSIYTGRVLIRRAGDFNTIAQGDIRGTQNAEYFGWSLGAADLNSDGYDELIVGAPLYSTTDLQEYGRVYVFKNTGGSLSTMDPIILDGDMAVRARFGTSITRIGDVNDDGYEDFAVGAPYQANSNAENTGKVYIYYGGQNYVSNSPGQEISADDVARVAGISQLNTFGWSLSSGVDVDNNQYQDLLIGAYESGTVVLFRALSVARISISATTNLVNNTLPIDLTNSVSPSFNLRICASFSGRGLTGRLDTNLTVEEVKFRGLSRLLFDGVTEDTKNFTFIRANMEVCETVVVTVQNKDNLYRFGTTVNNFVITFTLSQDERMTPPGFNGSVTSLSDLRETPILLISGTTSATIMPDVTCMTRDCKPDLQVTVLNYTYLSVITGEIFPNVVAGSTGVDVITTNFRIRNLDRDAAVGAKMQISMPTQFGFVQLANNTGEQITCDLITGAMHMCTLPNLIIGDTSIEVSLNWTRQLSVDGREPDFSSVVSVTVSNDTEPNNNMVTTTVQFSSIVDVGITSLRLRGPENYDGVAPPSAIRHFGQLGMRVPLTATLENRGPSTLEGADEVNFILYIPVRAQETGSNYYLYPGTLRTTGNAEIDCSMDNINPEGFDMPPETGSRRKRSAVSKRQMEPAPQDSIPENSMSRDCSDSQFRGEGCRLVDCTIRNWSPNQPVTITITNYIDRRFFSTTSNTYTFAAYANISLAPSSGSSITDDFSSNNQLRSELYTLSREQEDGDNPIIRIVVPIVAVIGALILIVALFCLLYFVGFFRRKKYGEEAEGDFEVREVPPPEGAVNGDKPGVPPPEDEVALRDSTPNKEDPTAHNDIGDASDLHDGEVAAADNDPDETSL